MLRTMREKKQQAPIQALSPSDDLYERIAKRAYQLYEERGGVNGYALDDWLQAEQEIRDFSLSV